MQNIHFVTLEKANNITKSTYQLKSSTHSSEYTDIKTNANEKILQAAEI